MVHVPGRVVEVENLRVGESGDQFLLLLLLDSRAHIEPGLPVIDQFLNRPRDLALQTSRERFPPHSTLVKLHALVTLGFRKAVDE